MYQAPQYLPLGQVGPQPPRPQDREKRLPMTIERASPQNWIYSLEMRQQPVRARMCGFGDKDRRPITPPPCVRLVIRDGKTLEELDPSRVNPANFVLLIDLLDSEGGDVNLVRSNSATSAQTAISSSERTTYPPPPEKMWPVHPAVNPMAANYMPNGNGYAMSMNPSYQANPAGPIGPNYQMGYPNPTPGYNSATHGNYTKNLIGALAINAFKLHDPEGKLGFWFILSDLSVRTEGDFRLRMRFFDIGIDDFINTMAGQSRAGLPVAPRAPANPLPAAQAPCLASTYTAEFRVYSAKKFPGVIESTDMSRCFSDQGIKIPVRKDGDKKEVANAEEFEADTP